jgi:PAS domain S-box-containing protein
MSDTEANRDAIDTALIEQVFQHSPLPALVVDADRRIADANRKALALFGRDRNKFVGTVIDDVLTVDEALKMVGRVFDKKREESVTTKVDQTAPNRGRRVSDDGGVGILGPIQSDAISYWRWQAIPIFGSGRSIDAVLLLMEDVTRSTLLKEEMRFNYEMLHSALAHIAMPVVRTNTEFRIVFANAAYYTTFGTDAERCLGYKICDTDLPETFCSIWRENHVQALREGREQVFQFELDSSEGVRRFQGEVAPEPSSTGRVRSLITFISDVTDIVEREEELENLLVEMNHRIKNNLINIESLARIEMDVGEKTKEEAINDIIGRIHAIAQVHETLYETKSFADVAIGPYLEELLQSLAATTSDGAAEYRVALESDEINVSSKIATKLGLIAAELITNTIKYAGCRENCLISVEIRRSGDAIEISYCDSGQGFGPEVQTIDDLPAGTGIMILHALSSDIAGSVALDTSKAPSRFVIRFPAPQEK